MEKQKKPIFKKWWFWVIVVILVGAVGSGLSGNDEPTDSSAIPESNPTESSPIIVEISVSVSGDIGKPEFTINTNLPDETELMLSLSGEDYMGQAKIVVKNGIATSEAFSNKGEALSGVFSLDVSMSLPRLQSDFVRSVIGEQGENISGPYVEKDDITGENVVNAESIYEYES